MATKSKKPDYQTYLQSPEWKAKRLRAFLASGGDCALCGEEIVVDFHVHHKTYAHLGNEPLDELSVLHPECHERLHTCINDSVEGGPAKCKDGSLKCSECEELRSTNFYNDNSPAEWLEFLDTLRLRCTAEGRPSMLTGMLRAFRKGLESGIPDNFCDDCEGPGEKA